MVIYRRRSIRVVSSTHDHRRIRFALRHIPVTTFFGSTSFHFFGLLLTIGYCNLDLFTLPASFTILGSIGGVSFFLSLPGFCFSLRVDCLARILTG